jgi:hypothetical protein
MSDRYGGEDAGAAVFRAALPGRPSGLTRQAHFGATLLAPGRGAFEAALVLAAFALLVPLCSPCALAAAVLARRAKHPRWLAAALAAAWCGLLGGAFRGMIGLGLAP